MKKTSLLISVLILSALLLMACYAPTQSPAESATQPATRATAQAEPQTLTETEHQTEEVAITMFCEKGLENGRPDMTHRFFDAYYESATDEASGLRYHRLFRVCHDCGTTVDFGAVRCKTNSHFCEAGCL